MKIYYCDNCQKTIKKLAGRAFQTGENAQGKIGTWCSKKCFKEYKGENSCQFIVGFNQLSMPIFVCETHGKSNSKYQRMRTGCYKTLARKIENLLK